jgi:hypothetical protein
MRFDSADWSMKKMEVNSEKKEVKSEDQSSHDGDSSNSSMENSPNAKEPLTSPQRTLNRMPTLTSSKPRLLSGTWSANGTGLSRTISVKALDSQKNTTYSSEPKGDSKVSEATTTASPSIPNVTNTPSSDVIPMSNNNNDNDAHRPALEIPPVLNSNSDEIALNYLAISSQPPTSGTRSDEKQCSSVSESLGKHDDLTTTTLSNSNAIKLFSLEETIKTDGASVEKKVEADEPGEL